MASLLLDDQGRPIPQVQSADGASFTSWKGENNAGRVTGDVDHDIADTGKPVKIGGKAADPAALPADVAAADRVNALFDLKGRLFVRQDLTPTGAATAAKQDTIIGYIDGLETLLTAIKDTDGIKKITDAIDVADRAARLLGHVDVDSSALPTGAATAAKQDTVIGYIDTLETLLTAIKDTDGIKKIVDPLPATNQEGTALASAARTATISSVDLANNHKNGVHVILDVTAITTAPSITLKIEGKCPVSGKYYTILEGAAVTAVSTNIYKVFPAATAAANSVANDIIPKTWRITVTHANADSITYSVGYFLM
ncbi:MAG: hypothetical protein C4589_11245 [Peptococcaceae bacterium]|jgi:hypothetical protein|nr:MAG: hypothetical protein C4589_11245 [Peptococcaceae bacterium]